MACLEQLQSDVSAILAFLQQSVPCCGDNITYGDSTTYTTIIIPGDGTAPAAYGETAVSDWDEWLEYLCHNANIWVDELIRAALTIGVALDTGGTSIALVASVLTAVAFIVVGGVLTLPFLAVIVAGLAANVSATIFEDAAVDLEDARDSIICAILSGRSVSDAVEDALSSGTAWDLLFSQIDYDSAVAILYEGGDGETYLESETDETCSCLCLHMQTSNATYNPMVYQSSAGAQFTMSPYSDYGLTNMLSGGFYFNRLSGISTVCGPAKIIDSISVSDGLKFTQIKTFDENMDMITEWAPNPTFGCEHLITVLEDEECHYFSLFRRNTVDNGCDTTQITVTLTYHDAE